MWLQDGPKSQGHNTKFFVHDLSLTGESNTLKYGLGGHSQIRAPMPLLPAVSASNPVGLAARLSHYLDAPSRAFIETAETVK